MADQVWTYLELTAIITARLTSEDLFLSLYDNNETPDKSSVFADFNIAIDPTTTLPLTWSLLDGDWTFATDSDGAVASQPPISQVVNGPLDLYGFLVYTASNVLVFAQRFTPAPSSLASGANAVILTPACHFNSP